MLSLAQVVPTRGSHDREALALCRGCPVQAECLADALATDDRFGIRAGLWVRQRRCLVQRRTRRAAVAVTAPSATPVPVGSAVGPGGAA
jgi:hypothetical protein